MRSCTIVVHNRYSLQPHEYALQSKFTPMRLSKTTNTAFPTESLRMDHHDACASRRWTPLLLMKLALLQRFFPQGSCTKLQRGN